MSENFEALVESARGGDEQAFRALVEPLARELQAYAYRMLGGFHDAEDVLQESRLKAWRALATYEPRASFRAWMYRIVTNTCLDMLKARSRRVLPQEVCRSVAPGPPTTAPRSDILWLEPYPDALLPAVPGPEQVARVREGIRLAFVRVVQVLPPRQRAALILHDVLDWSVAEVAAILETTGVAINSALQRARAAIARPREESPALASRHAEVVDRFVRAWESGDFDDFVELLATDAVMSMPPWEYWLDGKDAVVATMRSSGTWDGQPRPGRYRIVPAPMNGEPGALAYVRGPDGRYRAVCLTVMSLDADGRVGELTTFVLPELFAAWGFPPVLDASRKPLLDADPAHNRPPQPVPVRGAIRHDAEVARGLFGRGSELAAIGRALEGAAAGQARAVALVGEPGIGKTRLTVEAAGRASELGFVVCWGRAWEAGGAPPYWPWRQLLDALPGIERDGVLAQLWGGRSVAAADRDQARFALFEAVAAAIRRASASAPLLCVLDDLHAADVPSLELAAFATRDLRTSRVAWLMTWRDAEAERAPVCDLIARIAREAELIPLGRLSAAEATELARDVRSDTPAAVRDAIVNATAGNPLFLIETLACVGTRETLDVARLPLAQGVGAIVRERIVPLAPAVRRLLEAAALIGRDVEAPRWAIAADAPLELVRARAQEIRATGLLENVGIDRWRFSHDLVREAIARDAPRELVLGAHRRLALALDADVGAGDRSAIEARAHHALLADVDVDTALAWAVEAAEHARAQCAYEEALAILERAGAALGAGARGSPRFLLALGRAHVDVGDVRAARDHLYAALALARSAGDADLVARGVLALGARYVLGDVQRELIAEIDRATAALPEAARELHARLLARKAAALTPAANAGEVLDMARDALDLVAESPDAAARLEVAVAAGSAFADFAHPRERIPVNEELVRLARACGDRALELRGLTRLATDHVEAGDFGRADAVIAERDTLARALVLKRFAWHAPLFRSMRAMTRGDRATCDAALAEVTSLAAELDDPNVSRAVAMHRFHVLLLLGTADELLAAEAATLSAIRTMPAWFAVIVRCLVRFRAGELDVARAELESALADPSYGPTSWIATLSEPAAALGAPDQLRRLYDRLAPHADTYAVWGPGAFTCQAPIAASLGVLAAALGDRARAEQHFSAALAMTRIADTPALAARCESWRARALGTASPAMATTRRDTCALRPHADAWLVESARGTFLVPNVRGMAMLAQLLARPDVEIHALELVSGSAEPSDGGDAGPVLDARAIATYRKRAAELAEVVEQAEARGDVRRAETAQSELEALQKELARGVGLGGRVRRSGAAGERARITAQRRIREAIKKIGEIEPELAASLDKAIKTGTYCAYNSPK